MEENMEQVSAMVGNLRNMANDMGQEVERQNVQLDRINLKAGSDITRVKMANDQAAALMKKSARRAISWLFSAVFLS